MAKQSLTNQDLLSTSSKMLYMGIPFLPLMWLLHIAYHYPYYGNPTYQPIAQTLKKHMVIAATGVLVWTIAFITWWAIFATNRVRFGSFADSIIVNDVKGL